MEGRDQIDRLLENNLSSNHNLLFGVMALGLTCILLGLVQIWIVTQKPNTQEADLPAFPPARDSTFLSHATSSATVVDKVQINQATLDELDSLPGIGTIRAQQLIDHRPYHDFDDLEKRSGLSATALQKIKNVIQF